MRIDSYKVNRKHRNQKPKKDCTQWSISEWEEIRLFSKAKVNGWVCPKVCLWAIEKVDNRFKELGKSDVATAYLAKYVTNNNHEWHGYPVTTSRDADRPPTIILDSWRKRGIINKSIQGKIVKGKF